MFLVCNQCGNHNPEGATVCDLCQDPLTDEKEDRARRNLWLRVPAAIAVTLSLFFVPAIPVQLLLAGQGTVLVGVAFWVFYVGLWGVGFAVARIYRPKDIEKLDTGYRGGMLSLNPLTAARQNVDRSHVAIGLALFPIHLVNACWAPIFAALGKADRPPR
jgi:hypothetical protein